MAPPSAPRLRRRARSARSWLVAWLVVLGEGAAAQEGALVYERWTEVYEAGVKLGFGHERVEELPGRSGPRFVIRERHERWLDEGRVLVERRSEADADGGLLAQEARLRGPRGEWWAQARRDARGEVLLRRRAPGQPERALKIAKWVDCEHAALVLLARGARGPGEQRLRFLDAWGREGTQPTTWRALRRERGGVAISGPDGLEAEYDARGALLGARSRLRPHRETVVVPIEALARLAGRRRRGPAQPVLSGPGFALGRPPGRDWSLVLEPKEAGAADEHAARLEHGAGAGIVHVASSAGRPPQDAPGRKAMLERALARARARLGEDPRPLTLGPLEHALLSGCRGLRASVSLFAQGQRFVGEAWLVRSGERTLAAALLRLESLDAERGDALLATARAALHATGAPEQPALGAGRRAAVPEVGLLFRLPAGWTTVPPPRAPRGVAVAYFGDRGGQTLLLVIDAPPVVSPSEYLLTFARWVRSEHPGLGNPRLESHHRLGGRSGWAMVMEGHTLEDGARISLLARAFAFEDKARGRLVLVLGAVSSLGDREALDRLLESAEWVRVR